MQFKFWGHGVSPEFWGRWRKGFENGGLGAPLESFIYEKHYAYGL